MSSSKSYGLLVPKKEGLSASKHAAFRQSDSENSDDGGATDWVKKSLQTSDKSVKRHTKVEMQKALEQDNTVYQYDEVYDQLEQKKSEIKSSKERHRKPRYIEKLMQTADRRKRENERRIERQVQKEREAEGDQFKDKETFVTSAYKKKLEEFAAQEEEERRQNMLEEIGDVTKQQDISGFYRHLYQTTVDPSGLEKKSKSPKAGKDRNPKGSDKKDSDPKQDRKESEKSGDKIESNKKEEKDQKNYDSKETEKFFEKDSKIPSDKKQERHYRKRKTSESSEENVDADTSLSSSSSESDNEKDTSKKRKSEPLVKAVVDGDKVSKVKDQAIKNRRSRSNDKESANKESTRKVTKVEADRKSPELKKPDVKPPKKVAPDLSIWKKRTVGALYDEAVKRYFERKALRSRAA